MGKLGKELGFFERLLAGGLAFRPGGTERRIILGSDRPAADGRIAGSGRTPAPADSSVAAILLP